MSAHVRPMTADTVGTCDWGKCDDVTVAERLDTVSQEWLGVCARHKGGLRRQSPGRGVCPSCGKSYVLSVDGLLRLHRHGWETCLGSRGAPVKAKR